MRRALVTGVGATTPLGGDAPSTWAALLAGASGVRPIAESWADGLPVRIAAPALADPLDVLDPVEARVLDRAQRFAVVAAREAWADAGRPDVAPERLAVVVGTGIGGVLTLLDQYDVLRTRGPRRVSPYTVPMLMPNGPAAVVALELRARAQVRAPVSACASGGEAVAVALELLRSGAADVVVAGGTEAAIHPLPLAGFAQMRALAESDSRPFDAQRDGFVLGEGAGMLVLEADSFAAARGARGYAELAGAGLASDAYHLTAPDAEGAGAARAMRHALDSAGLAPADVDHVNAHATGTPVGDVAEARAIRAVLPAGVPVSATKAATGHLLGAAGAVEAIFAALAVRDGVVPGTRTYEKPDERCDVSVSAAARWLPVAVALSNSFGFGGHDVTLAFRRCA